MVKRFWACRISDMNKIPGGSIELEFMVSFDKRKDAEKYVEMNGDFYPSSTWTILEVWQKEVK